jgi:mono/diheme cytochrome c family protein
MRIDRGVAGLLRPVIAAGFIAAITMPAFAADPAAGASGDQAKAAEEGGQIYRSRCVLCHGNSGGRGPDLFATGLSEEQFVDIVINGRPGTQMPRFGYVLSPSDIGEIYAFVTTRDSAF